MFELMSIWYVHYGYCLVFWLSYVWRCSIGVGVDGSGGVMPCCRFARYMPLLPMPLSVVPDGYTATQQRDLGGVTIKITQNGFLRDVCNSNPFRGMLVVSLVEETETKSDEPPQTKLSVLIREKKRVWDGSAPI